MEKKTKERIIRENGGAIGGQVATELAKNAQQGSSEAAAGMKLFLAEAERLKNVDFDLFVVGGRTIYKLAYEYADRLYISLIKGHHEGNVYFPITDFSDFELKSNNETELVNYQIYERVK